MQFKKKLKNYSFFFCISSASAHLLYKQPEDLYRTVDKVKAFFRREGIACMTFQPEFLPKEESDGDSSPESIMASFDPSQCYSKCVDKTCDTITCLENEEDNQAINKGDCKSSKNHHHHHVHHHTNEEEKCLVSPSSMASTMECSLSPDCNSLTSFT